MHAIARETPLSWLSRGASLPYWVLGATVFDHNNATLLTRSELLHTLFIYVNLHHYMTLVGSPGEATVHPYDPDRGPPALDHRRRGRHRGHAAGLCRGDGEAREPPQGKCEWMSAWMDGWMDCGA